MRSCIVPCAYGAGNTHTRLSIRLREAETVEDRGGGDLQAPIADKESISWAVLELRRCCTFAPASCCKIAPALTPGPEFAYSLGADFSAAEG
jgi:hypothetical protein